jgi:hypothetical protein
MRDRLALAALGVFSITAMGIGVGSAVAAAPTVATATPTIADTTATLRCDVNPGGLSTNVWVTYKPSSAAWGSGSVVTTAQQVVTGSSTVTVDFPITGLSPLSSYDQRCKAKNSDVANPLVTATLVFVTTDGSTPTPTPTETPTPTPTPTETEPTGDVVIAVAGDICDDTPTQFDGIGCRGTKNQIINENPDWVLATGDLQYNNFAEMAPTVYEQEWGTFKAKTLPVLGNHELLNPPNSINAYNAYWGAQARQSTDYQYRVDLGKWSIIVVNSNYGSSNIPAANKTAVQNMIAAADAEGDNIAMAWHHPKWSSPCSGGDCHGNQPKGQYWMTLAYTSGVDVVLNSHDHRWEKFAPMSGTGVASDGVREFMIGSGGAHPDPGDGTPIAGSQLIKGDFVGVTFFTLSDTSYSWDAQEVTNVNGTATTFDSGTQSVR